VATGGRCSGMSTLAAATAEEQFVAFVVDDENDRIIGVQLDAGRPAVWQPITGR
jgi:hypothetical protein